MKFYVIEIQYLILSLRFLDTPTKLPSPSSRGANCDTDVIAILVILLILMK